MDKLKIALVGYGAMGKEIEFQAKDNFIITDIFDINNSLEQSKISNYDVAIEFTQPDSVINNIKCLAENGKNIVLGTTGWYSKFEEIKSIVDYNQIGLVWASNFSVGMNIFFKIIEEAATLASKAGDYDIFLHELHHKRKKDSPSGTAVSLSKIILNNFDHKSEAFFETAHSEIKPEQLHATSTRGGEIFGTHTVYIDSLPDTIELTHRARSRAGFANGALKAATLINGRKGIFEFPELLF